MAQKLFIVDLNLNGNQIKNVVIESLASAPASPTAGQFYYDTTKKQTGYWNGSAWVYQAAAVKYTASSLAADGTNQYKIYDSTSGSEFKFRAIKGDSLINLTQSAGVITIALKQLQISNISGLQAALDTKFDKANVDADGTLAANSDSKVASQKAAKTYIDDQISKVQAKMVGALLYVGTWDGTKSIANNLAAASVTEVKKGMFWKVSVAGTTSTVTTPSSGTALKIGDMIIANSDVAASSAAASNFDGIDNTESDDLVKLSAKQTLTNKTIDGGSNTFQNVPQSAVTGLTSALNSKFDASKVNASTLSASSTTTVPSEKTVADYVAGQISAQDIAGKIATAKQEAIDTAAADATSKVNALANGQVATNKSNIESLQTEIAKKTVIYKKEFTTGSTGSVLASAHGCGLNPMVQVMQGTVMVEAEVSVAANGDVTVNWNGSADASTKKITVIVVGI